jgi:hypothetical protein
MDQYLQLSSAEGAIISPIKPALTVEFEMLIPRRYYYSPKERSSVGVLQTCEKCIVLASWIVNCLAENQRDPLSHGHMS